MYSSASAVASLCPNLVAGSANFTDATLPTKVAVEGWLSSGCSTIHAALEQKGYSTPVTVGAAPAIHGKIVQLETFYGAAMAEYSRLTVRIAAKETTRAQMFMQMFDDGLASLVAGNLAQAGVSVSSTATIHVGGISKTRKDTVEDDTDRVEPRFRREQFVFPGTESEYSQDDD